MALCSACEKPLVLFIHDEGDDQAMQEFLSASDSTVPDEVGLCCGCRFHWQCLLDAYEVTTCPVCGKDISTVSVSGVTQVLCNLNNEGGLQTNLDILPILSEELYLKAYPGDRKARAFLEFCREGDIEAVVDLLKANDEEFNSDEDNGSDDEMENDVPMANDTLLRYQDPINNMRSGLHIAVANKNYDIVWLLLLLASGLRPEFFPQEVQLAVSQLQISRQDQTGKIDIRSLVDGDGRTALQCVESEFRSLFDSALLQI